MKSRFSHRTRLLSLLLTAVMVFTFLPTAVFADVGPVLKEINVRVKEINEGWGKDYVDRVAPGTLISKVEFEPDTKDEGKYTISVVRWDILKDGSWEELHYLERERIRFDETYRVIFQISSAAGYQLVGNTVCNIDSSRHNLKYTSLRVIGALNTVECIIKARPDETYYKDCTHAYGTEVFEAKEATCTESGNIKFNSCNRCGRTWIYETKPGVSGSIQKYLNRDEVITLLDHDNGWIPSTDDGLHVWGCRRCGYRDMSDMGKVGQCQYDDPADDTCNLCGRVRSCGLDLISVEITEPENGDTPDTAPKKDELSDIDFYTADAQWTTESGESVESFQEGEKYLCHFTFRASDTKVPFRNDIKISINGDILGTEGFADHLKLDSQTENEIKVTAAFTATHKHHYAAKWEKDAFYHWHECSCGAKKDRQMHTFDEPGSENICTVCRATREDGTDPVDPGSSGDGSAGAGIAIAIGGVAVASGIGVYYIWLNHQLKAILPEGTAVPANRGDLAMLLWSNAGKPEPEDQPAFTDVADPELAKAAQWCVEAGKMTMRGENRFAPDRYVFRQVVLNALKS